MKDDNNKTTGMDELAGVDSNSPAEAPAPSPGEMTAASGRAALRNRMKEKYPDRNWDEEGDDAEADQVMKDYDDLQAKNDKYETDNKNLGDLMERYPESASFLMDMASDDSDEDNVLARVSRHFGEDILELMQDPENQGKLDALYRERKKNDEENSARKGEWEKNMSATLERLSTKQEEIGLTDEQIDEGLSQLEQVVNDYLSGNISDDTLKMFIKGASYDDDVAKARTEGEVNGRNQQIDEKMRTRKAERNPLPSLGGQSNRGAAGQRIDRGKKAMSGIGSDIWSSANMQRNTRD